MADIGPGGLENGQFAEEDVGWGRFGGCEDEKGEGAEDDG